MWIVAYYRPVSLFSLKSSLATGSGAKTLLVPTPFAIRTALLDACIRTQGLAAGRQAFDWIKRLRLAVRPPEEAVVMHSFTKVLKPTRKEDAENAFDRTIAFREYVYQDGLLGLAFETDEPAALSSLRVLVGQINYFGKRGSFAQWQPPAEEVAALPPGFVQISGREFYTAGVIQPVDDWGESLTFEKLNVFSEERIAKNKDRVLRPLVLPYRLARSSKGFSYYRSLHVEQHRGTHS
jgi:hypothetical protein